MAHIEIIVHRDGTTTQKVKGVPGEACRQASKNYEALFGDVTSHEATIEAYTEPVRVAVEIENG